MTTKQFKKVALGDCCEIISGSTPSRNKAEYWDGEIAWFTPKDLSRIKSKYISEAPEKITALGLKSCSTTLLPKNTLLLSSRAPIGHIAITTIEACTNQGFKSLVPNKNLDVEYLFYAIKNIIPQLKDMGNGATFKEISKFTLSKVEIPLPQLAEQKQIAAILDAADSLRQKDQQLVEHYTALSQSLFLEMFGDIFINPFRFNVKKLESLVKKKSDIVDGPFGSSIDTKVDYVDDGEIPVIRTKNVSIDNNFVTDDLKFMRRSKYETVIRSQVLAGDIVLTKVGTIGNICIMPSTFKEAVLSTTGSCRIRADESVINKTYLLHYLNLYKPKMLEIASAGVQAFLNMKHIKNFNVLCPPLKHQNQFAERLAIIEQQKQQAQANLQNSEALFNSLLQRAFTGELTADKAA
ncbi:restriction endonuclease subunit S [Methylophaga sp.]|jgi:type I restriction enzyme S subunit|uniref:restriction endonuclease subunit S n=1 Tax=Methylophaga sp. TaxID=2024840 RepID=UPI003F6EC508